MTTEITRPDPYLLTAIAPDRAHLPTLDGLRAISIALVVLMHFGSEVPGAPPVPGLFGVEIFFAISGFLITRLLLAEILETGTLSLPNFYFRRALRLTPALAAFVLAASLFMAWHGARDLRASACAILYITNYCVTEVGVMYDGPGGVLEGTWSLGVEEHFYLMFPLVLLVFFRRDIRATYAAVAAICLTALAFRLGYAATDRPENFLVWRSESAFDLMMGGCALSIMSAHEAGRRALARVATTAFLGGATLVFIAGQVLAGYGKIGLALSQATVGLWLAVLIASLLLNPEMGGVRAVLNRPVMNWLGRISYSLYLWHAFVALADHQYHFLSGYAGVALGLGLSLALATASYTWLEQPILRRRSRWARKLGLGVKPARTAANSTP